MDYCINEEFRKHTIGIIEEEKRILLNFGILY